MADPTANPYLDPVTGLPKTGTSAAWLGTQPQVANSMAGNVTALAGKDSALNQMARTEGLKVANTRGLLNSSMAVGAAQDAVLKNVMPIASQDAAQAFQKNMAAKAFEYGMTAQQGQQQFQTGERLGGQAYGTSERLGAQAYGTSERLGSQAYGTSERLGSQAYGTSERLGTQKFQTGENVAARGWQTAENIAQRGFLGTQADLDRDLQALLQKNQITSAEKMGFAQIASTEGIEAANRALAKALQEKDIQFRMSEGKLDRAQATAEQQRDITFQTTQNAATRALQEKIAKMNLSSTERASASQFITNMETMYQSNVASVMGNTALTADQRTTYLTAFKNLRNNQLNLVEQMYNIDLSF